MYIHTYVWLHLYRPLYIHTYILMSTVLYDYWTSRYACTPTTPDTHISYILLPPRHTPLRVFLLFSGFALILLLLQLRGYVVNRQLHYNHTLRPI